MKSAPLGNATRTVGKVFFGFVLLCLAIAAGFGGTALVVYHQLNGNRPAETRIADRAKTERREAARPAQPAPENAVDRPQARRVAATSSDLPSYSYADNNGGQPSMPAKRQKPATNVPAALENSAPPATGSVASGSLNDPESHYIVDSRTGRVVGIDGSAGAQREAEEEQRRLDAAPRAVAVQTPVPEVRVASPVMEYGQPIYHDAQPVAVNAPGAQYVPVRRAMPVNADDTAMETRNFNVAQYLASNQSRPSLRAQPVAPTGASRAHVFRLPDGTRAVVTD